MTQQALFHCLAEKEEEEVEEERGRCCCCHRQVGIPPAVASDS